MLEPDVLGKQWFELVWVIVSMATTLASLWEGHTSNRKEGGRHELCQSNFLNLQRETTYFYLGPLLIYSQCWSPRCTLWPLLTWTNFIILLACFRVMCTLLLCFLWQHLVQWDAGNPESLLQLVKELIQQYHLYQCQRLRESSRLLFEYDSLLEDPSYSRNMEIYAGLKNSWVTTSLLLMSEIKPVLFTCKAGSSGMTGNEPLFTLAGKKEKQEYKDYICQNMFYFQIVKSLFKLIYPLWPLDLSKKSLITWLFFIERLKLTTKK